MDCNAVDDTGCLPLSLNPTTLPHPRDPELTEFIKAVERAVEAYNLFRKHIKIDPNTLPREYATPVSGGPRKDEAPKVLATDLPKAFDQFYEKAGEMGVPFYLKNAVEVQKRLEDWGFVEKGSLPAEEWKKDARRWLSEQQGIPPASSAQPTQEEQVPGGYADVNEIPGETADLFDGTAHRGDPHGERDDGFFARLRLVTESLSPTNKVFSHLTELTIGAIACTDSMTVR